MRFAKTDLRRCGVSSISTPASASAPSGECLLAAGYLTEDDGEVITHLWEADGDRALVYNGLLRDSARR